MLFNAFICEYLCVCHRMTHYSCSRVYFCVFVELLPARLISCRWAPASQEAFLKPWSHSSLWPDCLVFVPSLQAIYSSLVLWPDSDFLLCFLDEDFAKPLPVPIPLCLTFWMFWPRPAHCFFASARSFCLSFFAIKILQRGFLCCLLLSPFHGSRKGKQACCCPKVIKSTYKFN